MIWKAMAAGLFLLAAAAMSSAAQAEQTPVRVGIYQNSPKVAWSESGKPEGIFVDLIEAIAADEDWSLEYVPGTWAEGLDRLAKGEIDLMPDVAFSADREKLYAFHREPVLSDWFQVYTRRGSGIRSLLDLNGKRVAVLERSIQQDAFEKMIEGFDLATTLVARPDYDNAFSAVAEGEADAVIANRFYGAAHLRGGTLEDTAIVFFPTRVFFAAPLKADRTWLDAIDRHLAEMKQDPSSIYFRSLERWTSEKLGFHLPAWIKVAGIAAAAFLLLSLLWSLSLKQQVSRRTRELKLRNKEIESLYETVRESEERFRSYVEHANDLVFSLSPDGAFTYVSPNWKEFMGHEVSDVVGKSFRDFVHPEDQPACLAAMERARQGEKQSGVEYRVRHQDGSWRWHSTNGTFNHGTGGDFYLGISRDNTPRKLAEEELRRSREALMASEERYRLITSVSMDYVFSSLVEPDGRLALQWVSGAFENITGYSYEEYVACGGWRARLHPDDLVQDARDIQILQSNKPLKSELRTFSKDGTLVWVEVFAHPVWDEKQSRLAGIYGAVRDITSRKQAEAEMQATYDTLNQFIDSVPAFGSFVDTEERYQFVNQFYEDWFQKPREHFVGRRLAEVHRPATYATMKPYSLKALAGQSVRYEHEMTGRDGTYHCFDVQYIPRRNSDGAVLGYFTLVFDITARKQAEKEKEHLQSQLIQAQKMEAIGRLAGGVAHDFNNMLCAILGNAELILADTKPAHPHYADLQEIRKATERSADLTRQLLAFARKQTVSPQILDLNATVEGMLKMLRRLIGENIGLFWQPAPDLGSVKIDPSQIDQILANLCVNARDAISGVGRITLESANISFSPEHCALHAGHLPGDYVMLAVSDNGSGMDKETLGQLFEPFFTTKAQGKGTGLGLATVYGIVKQNSGFIDVFSEPDRGSTFKVYLPRHAHGMEIPSSPRIAGPVVPGQETILLVEDEPSILAMGKTMLEKLGYRVFGAATPSEALRLAKEYSGEIDLLMTDVVMPEMNGRELSHNLSATHPELKRLYMSGYTADAIAHHGVLDEGVHFIQKPFTMATLAAKVRETLDS